jgi:phosphoribosylformylglycinamidine synthase
VLRTAGINCDGETVRALELSGAAVDLLHLKLILAEPARLGDYSLLVIPGGFSYGDDVAAGRVFGLELRHGLARELATFVERGGFVLGVCNGFQVLVESGLFEPGVGARSIALTDNASNHFECRWVNLVSQDCACPWIEPGEPWPAPIAHGEGRFVVRDEAALARLVANRQIALRYVREGGASADRYPDNPNGSVHAIAGLLGTIPTGRACRPARKAKGWLSTDAWWKPLRARRSSRTSNPTSRICRRLCSLSFSSLLSSRDAPPRRSASAPAC